MADDVTTVKTPNRTNPPTRRDRADATRLRIVKAAYELFCERGYAGTMLSDIAAAAGVAVQTVRFNFHTKGELLSRAYDFAVLGEGEPVPPQKQPWWAAAAAAPDVTAPSGTWSRASARSWRAPLRWTPWSAAASPAIPKPPASGRSTSGGARKAIGRCSTSCSRRHRSAPA